MQPLFTTNQTTQNQKLNPSFDGLNFWAVAAGLARLVLPTLRRIRYHSNFVGTCSRLLIVEPAAYATWSRTYGSNQKSNRQNAG